MANGNTTNWTTLAGVVAAVVLGILQATQGTRMADNHEMTHERISDIEDTIMNKGTVEAHVENLEDWQKAQDLRINNLESQHDIHEHFEDLDQ